MGDVDMADSDALWSGSVSPAPEESFWDFLPSGSQIIDTLVGAGVARGAYEITKPISKASTNPLGAFGKVGTVGVELGQGTQTIVWVAIAAAAGFGLFLLLKK